MHGKRKWGGENCIYVVNRMDCNRCIDTAGNYTNIVYNAGIDDAQKRAILQCRGNSCRDELQNKIQVSG